MDLPLDAKAFLVTFSTLFLAEMGDKTQLAVINLSASSGKPLSVFLGGAAALAVVTALGAFFGAGIARVIPAELLQKGASVLFVGIGLWMWFKG